MNSVTREPIPGALVYSPDNRFAARTDSQGHFEIPVTKTEPNSEPKAEAESYPAAGITPDTASGTASAAVSQQEVMEPASSVEPAMPLMLSARKPGYLENENISALDLAQHAKEITLLLVPEAVIAGHVSMPGSEAPDKIQLQLFRRTVQNGIAQWTPAGNAGSNTNGDFRFADLLGGTYKLLTRELLDRNPSEAGSHGQQYGYPPVYYPDAGDFASAGEIDLSPGETSNPTLTLARQPYFNVKIAVANVAPSVYGMNVDVSSRKGHPGPGYALGYNSSTQKIEGLLPNGVYTVEARSYGKTAAVGTMTLVVKGAPVLDARMDFVPASSLVLDVKEEFTGKPMEGSFMFTQGQRTFSVRGPRRYLNVYLESADEFAQPTNGFLRPPSGPGDQALEIPDVSPGRYWVRVQSSHGYAASVRSGSTDLLREPLVVSAGGGAIPVEIVMRDDSAAIAGQVEELASTPGSVSRGLPPAFVYCIPTADSTGQFIETGVSPDGTFSSPPLAPGQYRVLAFDHQQLGLEYRNAEAMKAYESMGSVVQVAGGQTEHVTLQLSSTRESLR